MGKIGFRALCTAQASAAVLFAAVTAHALPGDLDPTFGGFGTTGQIQETGQTARAAAIDSQGRLVIAGGEGTFTVQRRSGGRFLTAEDEEISFPGQESSSAAAVAIAADGKIVVAGDVQTSGDDLFGIARLNPDLSLDATFAGGTGLLTSDHDGTDLSLADVAVQSDGKIVIVGDFSLSPTERAIAVQRFNEDGSPDSGFDGDGQVTFTGDNVVAAAVAIQADGRIVVAGSIEEQGDFIVFRLETDGSLEETFSQDGFATVEFGEIDGRATDLTIAPDGKIVIAGTDSASTRVLVARFFPDGQLDTDLDGDGVIVTEITDSSASARSVVVQPDGKIVVAGEIVTNGSSGAFLLIRYYQDGVLDDTFGGSPTLGVVITAFDTAAAATALALQADGMLVAVGGGQAARYRWDGALDAGGLVTLAFHPEQTRGEVTGLAVDGSGRLVAAGTVRVADLNMAVARFDEDYSNGLDLSFGTDDPPAGRTMYGLDDQNEEVQALAIRSDDKPVITGQVYSTGATQLMIGRLNVDGTPDLQCDAAGFSSTSFGFGNDEGRALALGPEDRTYTAARIVGPEGFDYGAARFAPACTVDTFGTPPVEYKLALDISGADFPNGVVYQSETDRPVLAGITDSGDVVLVRILADDSSGTLGPDPSFGVDGYASADLGTGESVAGIANQSDGRMVVAGAVADDFYVIRFTADGELDGTFGDGGVAVADVGGRDGAQGLAVRADDSIAVVGSTFSEDTSRTVFAVAQFTADGELDTAFGTGGTATVEFGADGSDAGQAVTFLGPDRLVVGGFTQAAGIRRFALAALETVALTATSCVGDCDGDDMVFVDELVTMLNIALGTANVSTCDAGDSDGSGTVTVDEILTAVNHALNGCPAA